MDSYITYWDWNYNKPPEPLIEVSAYNNEEEITVFCTQLDHNYTAKDKKRIVIEWCDFFKVKRNIKTIWFSSRVPQELFDAVCLQENLEGLYIKCTTITTIQSIYKLKNLKHFYLGNSSKICSLEPIYNLTEMKTLAFENLQKVTNYNVLSKMTKLNQLQISGNIWNSKMVLINNLDFLQNFHDLEMLDLVATSVVDKNYYQILTLSNLKCFKVNPKLITETLKEDIKNKFPNLISKL